MSKSTQTSAASFYELKGWQVKTMGPKPSVAEFEAAHKVNKPGQANTLAIAMYMRGGGATSTEVTNATGLIASGGPQLNRKKALVEQGLLADVPTPKRDGKQVYKVKFVKAKATVTKAAAKPKPKAPAKPKRKAKATKRTK